MRRSARQRLGQHFLIDPVVAARIVESLKLDPERDVVVEIGAGKGALTEMLVGKCARVVAVELDFHLAEELRRRFADRPYVQIVYGDFLKQDLRSHRPEEGRLRVIGNIPYSITSPIILHLLRPENRGILYDATLTVQSEVAERIIAGPGTKTYGVLSVLSQILAEPEFLFGVPPRAFRPRPRVSSGVVRWKNFVPPADLDVDESILRKTVRNGFAQRRKMLKNALAWLGEGVFERLQASGWDLSRRPEQLSPGEWLSLARAIQELVPEKGEVSVGEAQEL